MADRADGKGGVRAPARQRTGARRAPVDQVSVGSPSAGRPRRPHAARAQPAVGRVRDRRGARGRVGDADRSQEGRVGVRLRLRAPRRPAAPVGRGLHPPPGRRGEDLRRHAARHRDALRRDAARHRRGHVGVAGRGAPAVRRRDREHRRRRHEAHRHHLSVARRGAGRELPQDDARDGQGRAGHPDQARRPPAQHAHDRGDVEAEADRQGEGDPGDLRADRPSARHPRDQVGARGPRLPGAAPAQVRRDQGPRQPAARGARAIRREGRRLPRRASSRRSTPSKPTSPAARSTSIRSTRR